MPARIRSKVPAPRIGSLPAASKPSIETRMSSEYSLASESSRRRRHLSGVRRSPFVRTVAGPCRSVSSRIASISGFMNGSPPVK